MRIAFALVLLSLAALPLPLRAEVTENLDWTHYEADHQRGESLLQTMNRSSPIRQDGKTFHGYTKWNVNWNFRWWREADGRCRITEVTVRATGEITLPELTNADASTRDRFDSWLSNLREHELGHFAFAQQAASEIDSGILGLPEHPSCESLESAANALGKRIVAQAADDERAYDRETEHGRTQGAWLER